MRKPVAITISAVIVIAFVGLICRCAYLQIASQQKFQKQINTIQRLNIVQPCRRGMILGRNGNQLAVSNIIYNVFADPAIIKDHKQAAITLSDIINMPAEIISKKITKARNHRYAVIAKDITLSQVRQIRSAKIKGIAIEAKWKRYNPHMKIFSHIVGLVGSAGKGLTGLELKYQSILQGHPGLFSFTADSARRPIRPADTHQRQPLNGSSLILTLDSTIQSFTYNALIKQYKKFHAQAATAIVINPKTGAVLSMVSLPDFDPDNLKNATNNQLRNRAISETYEPGSIFKPIVACIALDEGVITRTEKIFCENGFYHGKGFGTIREYHHHEYSNLDIKEILIHSSNIGMAKIGQRLGKKRLYDGIKLFGFSSKTGIDLPNEDAGIVWPLKKWTGYSTTRIPYGQEILVTAIQIAKAYCILANSGRDVKPYIVEAIISDDGKKIKLQHNTVQAGFIVKKQNADWIVRKALTEVVNQGTGKKAALDKWQVFGKTGTANIASNGKGYDEKNYIASFVGGAPAENPKLVVVVSIWKPDKSLNLGYTGGTVSGPVVKEILEKSLTYLEHNPRR